MSNHKELLLDWPNLPEVCALITVPHAPNYCDYLLDANREQVARNRAAFVVRHGLIGLATATQVHGTRLIHPQAALPSNTQADALATTTLGLAVGVFTADCVPVLVVHIEQGKATQVLVIHAGRKGVVGRIVQKALKAYKPENLRVWLGPAICTSCYEIDGDIARQQLAAGFSPQYLIAHGEGKFLCDLRGEITHQLTELGVTDVHNTNLCTKHQLSTHGSPVWYSHRNGNKGRMMSAMWLRPSRAAK